MLLPRAKDAVDATWFRREPGANSDDLRRERATPSQLSASCYKRPMLTSSEQRLSRRPLLRLDPFWDPLRADPAFQKLCEEKQPVAPEVLTQSAPEKSIAVLPFENLSEEKANAYFAEGVQNEVLTRLAAVRDLKVISRTSTAKYQSKPDNLMTLVAQELGVSTILEGAVQKAGDKVRINVQLIDARTDTHLWARSYDRDFKDVLRVESEVSQVNCG